MSIKQLVSEIKEYVDSKEGNFRLLFCVDEVGQYIGDDGDLMMNLQSLVEEIGDKCRGKVWVMVTSQEAIDSVVKITGNDFSKIQGRFNTRLSLSSSSVDEVIKKRVLAKTEDADHLLQMEYEKEASGLKSLFAFDNPILDIKGFTSAAEFSATFPFVPYSSSSSRRFSQRSASTATPASTFRAANAPCCPASKRRRRKSKTRMKTPLCRSTVL